MSSVSIRDSHSPSNYLSRFLENTLISCKNTNNKIYHHLTCFFSKCFAFAIMPRVLAIEGLFESFFLSKSFIAYQIGCKSAKKEVSESLERIHKLGLAYLNTPWTILSADAVSFHFLRRPTCNKTIAPFGVETIYGLKLSHTIDTPSNIEELREIILDAKKKGQKISLIGSGLSQGTQTVPLTSQDRTIHLKKLNSVKVLEKNGQSLAQVGAGATWEEVQKVVNQKGKSIIVKQASDIFSVGGSIGINCHGWEHDYGAISSTVESLTIINAKGDLRTISPKKDPELFKAMFGSLGYFGVIVSATLRLKDNVMLEERAIECPISEFDAYYKKHFKNNPQAPLLMGRLNIDKNPLQKLYINTFELTQNKTPLVTPNFQLEKSYGQRIERIFLNALGHLPQMLYEPMARFYWNREVKLMTEGHRIASRNEIMHFGIKSFSQLHQSNLYTQWLQEYFISPDNLPRFLKFLGKILEENDVRLLNASIRPVPKDSLSLLPYAEKDRYALVISFHQLKTKKELEKTRDWIKKVQSYLLIKGDKWYQAYMPFASQREFVKCYGEKNIESLRKAKQKYDPENLFSNRHTAKYYDEKKSQPIKGF